jgi:hypothetical protein
MRNAPAWLTARPIAHRGLHDRAHGVIENTCAAALGAIAAIGAVNWFGPRGMGRVALIVALATVCRF